MPRGLSGWPAGSVNFQTFTGGQDREESNASFVSSFESRVIESQSISQNLLRVVRAIGECKGKQDLFREQSPQVLKILQSQAIIESTESSNRIEGVTVPRDRILELLAENPKPLNRSEGEIAGYRYVLELIHVNAPNMAFTPNLLLQLHRDLYQYVESAIGGQWKSVDNEISEKLPGGGRRTRFVPVHAHLTPDAMRVLHEEFEKERQLGEIEPLLLIATYVLDFLCIHPFLDGNGRMARLLALLLLYQHGYEVGRFVSLERKVEETKSQYYETLEHASQRWHEGGQDLTRWWDYFLGVVVLGAYKEFETRVGTVTEGYGSKATLIEHFVKNCANEFTVSDVARACPTVSRPTINRALRQLQDVGRVELINSGRNARYRVLGSKLQVREHDHTWHL